MEFNKKTRAVLGFGLLAVLIFVPLRVEVGYVGIYYTVLALLGIWGGFQLIGEKRAEERFFHSWERKKSWPKALVVLTESIKSLVYMLVVVAFGQIIVDGRRLGEMVTNMPLGARVGIPAMLIAFSIILGFANLYEKNRRYDRLYSQFHP